MRIVACFSAFALLLFAGCGEPPAVEVPATETLKKYPPGDSVESEASVPGVGNILYTIDLPEEGAPGANSQGRPLVVVLHYGYDGSKPTDYTGGDLVDTWWSAFEGMGAIVIAPDVVSGDWRDTKNEKAVAWLTRSAIETYNIDPKRVLLTGYSMGGEGTLFIGSRHQDLFTAAIPVAAPVAGGTEWKIPVFFVHSQNDELVSHNAAKKHADAISASGGTVEFESVSGLDHFSTDQYDLHVAKAVQWVQRQWAE